MLILLILLAASYSVCWWSLSTPQETRQYQRAARDSRVVMYRQYREGELPDIQIKYSELIRPLQALAQVCVGEGYVGMGVSVSVWGGCVFICVCVLQCIRVRLYSTIIYYLSGAYAWWCTLQRVCNQLSSQTKSSNAIFGNHLSIYVHMYTLWCVILDLIVLYL